MSSSMERTSNGVKRWSLEGTFVACYLDSRHSLDGSGSRPCCHCLDTPKDARRKRRVQAHGALPVEVVELRHVDLVYVRGYLSSA
jgi:hypothetical protein